MHTVTHNLKTPLNAIFSIVCNYFKILYQHLLLEKIDIYIYIYLGRIYMVKYYLI